MSETMIPNLISAVVTFHRERELAVPTLHAIERMRRYAEAQGLRVELAMTLDGDDSQTEEAVRSHPVLRERDVLHKVQLFDLSLLKELYQADPSLVGEDRGLGPFADLAVELAVGIAVL